MVRRRDTPAILVSQTAHGWLAGQFAAHWGNSRFQHPAKIFPDDAALPAAWQTTPLSFRVFTFRVERV